MNPSREAIMLAVWNKLITLVPAPSIPAGTWTASAGNDLTTNKPLATVARRVQIFSNSGPKPAIYIGEFGNTYKWQSESLGSIQIEVLLFIYIDDGSDPNKVPAISMNNIIDLLDALFVPDNLNGKCTLGGLVSSTRVSGEVPVASGDLGGPGIAVIPLNILVPNGDLS